MDCDTIRAGEKLIGFLAPSAQDRKDFLNRAPAVEAEGTRFEEVCFLGFSDFLDVGIGEVFEPLEIGIRLRGDECEVLVFQSEGAGGALLGLLVELGDPFDRIAAIYLEGGVPWLAGVRDGGLGVEIIAIRLADVFGENAAGNILVIGGACDEKVDAGCAEIGRPGDGFRPWACCEMEGEDGEGVLEHLVELRGIAELVLHEVEIVIRVNAGELTADEQAVPVPDEGGLDFCEVFWLHVFVRVQRITGFCSAPPRKADFSSDCGQFTGLQSAPRELCRVLEAGSCGMFHESFPDLLRGSAEVILECLRMMPNRLRKV